MRVILGPAQRGPVLSSGILVGSLAVLGFTVFAHSGLQTVVPAVALVVAMATWYRTLLSWRWLIAMIIAVVLAFPIKKYTLPASLPFSLEPYRVLVAVVIAFWLTSLLIDPRVRLRRTIVDGPLLLLGGAVALSMVVNPDRVAAVNADAVKRVTFFFSFVVLVYLVASVLRGLRDIDFAVQVLTLGGGIVAVFAIVESRTGYNVFDHLGGIIPFVDAGGFFSITGRGARLRVFASAQHPIALGAALVMLVPLAVYGALGLGRRWYWLVGVVLLIGGLATVSRTAVTSLAAATIVLLVLRGRELKRYWPAAVVLLVVVHLVIPGTLGTLRASFFPAGGLIAEQSNQRVGSGRLATLGPALDQEFKPNPILGEGYGTRVTRPDENVLVTNAPITDNQWLDLALETGIVGLFAAVWLFFRFVRRLGREARADSSRRGWLAAALAASAAAYGVGMFTYDAFSFIQVTFLFFVLLGLGSALMNTPRPADAPAAVPVRSPRRLPARQHGDEPIPGFD